MGIGTLVSAIVSKLLTERDGGGIESCLADKSEKITGHLVTKNLQTGWPPLFSNKTLSLAFHFTV